MIPLFSFFHLFQIIIHAGKNLSIPSHITFEQTFIHITKRNSLNQATWGEKQKNIGVLILNSSSSKYKTC